MLSKLNALDTTALLFSIHRNETLVRGDKIFLSFSIFLPSLKINPGLLASVNSDLIIRQIKSAGCQ